MGNHGWVASTPNPAHGHLSDCDDRGCAFGRFGFAAVEALGLLRSFHQDGYAEIDVFVAQVGVAGTVAHPNV